MEKTILEKVDELCNKTRSPLKRIRIMCLHCTGFSYKDVTDCTNKHCPIYPFRLGTNTLRKKLKHNKNKDLSKRFLSEKSIPVIGSSVP